MNVQLTREALVAPPALRQPRLRVRDRYASVFPVATDLSLRDSVLARLALSPGWDPETSNIVVHDGVVTLQGLLSAGFGRRRARALVAGVPGVRAVEDVRVLSRDW